MKFVFVFLVESFYRERYIQKSKEQEQLRKKLQSQAEQEIEELSNQKRTLERKVGPFLLNLVQYLLILATIRPTALSAKYQAIFLAISQDNSFIYACKKNANNYIGKDSPICLLFWSQICFRIVFAWQCNIEELLSHPFRGERSANQNSRIVARKST